jgi:hypothetical protein
MVCCAHFGGVCPWHGRAYLKHSDLARLIRARQRPRKASGSTRKRSLSCSKTTPLEPDEINPLDRDHDYRRHHRRGNVLDLRTKNHSGAYIPLTDEQHAAIEIYPTSHLTHPHTRSSGQPLPISESGTTLQACPGDARSTASARAAAQLLAKVGASIKQIKALTGHKTLAEVQRCDDANGRSLR